MKQGGGQAIGCLKDRGPCFSTDLCIDKDGKTAFSYFSSGYQAPRGKKIQNSKGDLVDLEPYTNEMYEYLGGKQNFQMTRWECY